MQEIKFLIFLAVFIIGSFSPVNAQVAQGGNYKLEQAVIGSGGGVSSDAANNVYKIEGSVGEPVAGTTSSNMAFSVKGGFFTSPALAPTAAAVSISGRVITPQTLGLTNALVTLTDMQGNSKTVMTGKSGRYRFINVVAGETYILSVSSKRYIYAPQMITLNEDLTEVNFMAQ